MKNAMIALFQLLSAAAIAAVMFTVGIVLLASSALLAPWLQTLSGYPVAAAGLILVGTFGSFASADVIAVKEIGIGLAVGVLIDSTIVRVIMVSCER